MERLKDEFIGKNTLERLRKTKLYSYAYFISEMRYNQTEENKYLIFPTKTYMNDLEVPKVALIENNYADTAKMLAEIQMILEWLALKEVT